MQEREKKGECCECRAIILVATFFFFAFSLNLFTAVGLADQPPRPASPRLQPVGNGLATQVVTSDFDLDSLADDAYFTSQGTQKSIAFRMGDSGFNYLTFSTETPSAGTLRASDIDNDDDIDLVWYAPGSETPTILLGDGKGNFTRLDDPDKSISSGFTARQSAPEAESGLDLDCPVASAADTKPCLVRPTEPERESPSSRRIPRQHPNSPAICAHSQASDRAPPLASIL